MSLKIIKISSQKGRKITWGDKISKAKKGVRFSEYKFIECLHCNNELEVRIISDRKFCSQECYQT